MASSRLLRPSKGHPWRARVVPPTRDKNGLPVVSGRRRRWIAWANLLRRVYLFDVLACVCGGRKKVIAAIREGPVARRILEHLGLPSTVPRPAPARDDPQGDLWPTGPPAEDVSQDSPPTEFDQRVPEFEVGP